MKKSLEFDHYEEDINRTVSTQRRHAVNRKTMRMNKTKEKEHR